MRNSLALTQFDGVGMLDNLDEQEEKIAEQQVREAVIRQQTNHTQGFDAKMSYVVNPGQQNFGLGPPTNQPRQPLQNPPQQPPAAAPAAAAFGIPVPPANVNLLPNQSVYGNPRQPPPAPPPPASAADVPIPRLRPGVPRREFPKVDFFRTIPGVPTPQHLLVPEAPPSAEPSRAQYFDMAAQDTPMEHHQAQMQEKMEESKRRAKSKIDATTKKVKDSLAKTKSTTGDVLDRVIERNQAKAGKKAQEEERKMDTAPAPTDTTRGVPPSDLTRHKASKNKDKVTEVEKGHAKKYQNTTDIPLEPFDPKPLGPITKKDSPKTARAKKKKAAEEEGERQVQAEEREVARLMKKAERTQKKQDREDKKNEREARRKQKEAEMQTKKEDREKREKMKAEREAKKAEKAENKTKGDKRKPADEDPSDRAIAVRQKLQRTTDMDYWQNSSANDLRFQLGLRGKRDLPGTKSELMAMVKSMIEDGTWDKTKQPSAKSKVIKSDSAKVIKNNSLEFWLKKGIDAVKTQLKARGIPVPRSNEKVMEKLRSVIQTPAWLEA